MALLSRISFRYNQPAMRRAIKKFRWGAVAVFPFLWLAACSIPPAKVTLPKSPGGGPGQTGIASWYGPGFYGKATASGSIYGQEDLTAAHQTLPLGTHLLVTNLQNGSTIQVTVNDRGPFAKGRILDLSYA